MRLAKRILRVIGALCLVALALTLTGCACGGYTSAGPVTPGNIINDYPPMIRDVVVMEEASEIVVNYQPYDAQVPKLQGWYFVPQQGGQGRRSIQFSNPSISGNSNLGGQASFVMSGTSPIQAGRKLFFMITVTEQSFNGFQPRSANASFEYLDGKLTRTAG
jgi:hypothetical protein